jgi:hypothetical protein
MYLSPFPPSPFPRSPFSSLLFLAEGEGIELGRSGPGEGDEPEDGGKVWGKAE